MLPEDITSKLIIYFIPITCQLDGVSLLLGEVLF